MCEIEHAAAFSREGGKKMSDLKTLNCVFFKFFFRHYTVVTN